MSASPSAELALPASRLERVRVPGSTQALVLEREPNGDVHVRAEDGTWYATLGSHRARFANDVEERWELDWAGRPTRLAAIGPEGEDLVELRLDYGEDGRVRSFGDWQVAFEGRFVGRLTRGDETLSLEHDEAGNLVGRSGVRLLYDGTGRLQELRRASGHAIRFEHDANGNRSARRDAARVTAYRYDESGRLAEVRRGRHVVVRYAYDALGRRVRREADGETRELHYDPQGNLVAETDGEGRTRATYLWACRRCLGRIDGPVGEPVAEWHHLDHRGTAQAVTGPHGELLSRHDGDPLEPPSAGPFQGKLRDPVTGFYDFGCRDFDPETGSFTTPDAWTWDVDDPRLAVLGLMAPGPHTDPARRNRYAFCLGDPIDNVDLDGHSAWWFFLTIPSSLIWAMPNTVIALIIVFGNLLLEILGWIIWFFGCIILRDFDLKHYPWGNLAQSNGNNSTNPFDLDDRAHLWFGMEASARLGVPWALLNGSFFVWRPYTLGNVIFAEDMWVAADEAEPNARFVVPNDPDVQLNREGALWNHEMQHVFQYAYLGPLFHCLPLPPLARLISNAVGDDPLADRDEWWEKIDLGGLTWAVGGLFWLLTGGNLKPDDFAKWVNPATWWRELLPNKVVDIAANAIDFDNWLPGVGVYEMSSVWFTNQQNSFFERDAGAHSGDVYQTVVEVEEDELFVGQFTRVVGADAAVKASPPSADPVVDRRVHDHPGRDAPRGSARARNGPARDRLRLGQHRSGHGGQRLRLLLPRADARDVHGAGHRQPDERGRVRRDRGQRRHGGAADNRGDLQHADDRRHGRPRRDLLRRARDERKRRLADGDGLHRRAERGRRHDRDPSPLRRGVAAVREVRRQRPRRHGLGGEADRRDRARARDHPGRERGLRRRYGRVRHGRTAAHGLEHGKRVGEPVRPRRPTVRRRQGADRERHRRDGDGRLRLPAVHLCDHGEADPGDHHARRGRRGRHGLGLRDRRLAAVPFRRERPEIAGSDDRPDGRLHRWQRRRAGRGHDHGHRSLG